MKSFSFRFENNAIDLSIKQDRRGKSDFEVENNVEEEESDKEKDVDKVAALDDPDSSSTSSSPSRKSEKGRLQKLLVPFYPIRGKPFTSFVPSVEYASIV